MTPFAGLARAARALRVLVSLPREDRRDFAAAYRLQLAEAVRRRWRRRGAPWLPEGALRAPDAWGAAPDPRRLAVFARAEECLALRLDCLPRALALGRYLADNGCHTQLVLGVRRGVSGIEGHAWRRWGSRVLQGESHAARFSPLSAGVSGWRTE